MKKKLKILLVLSITIVTCSCSDDDKPYKPEFSPVFKVELERNNDIASAGKDTLNIIIESGTNGWWVTMTEGASWCKAQKNFGAGDYTLPIIVSENKTGETRSVEVTIHSTYDLPSVGLTIKQEKE